MYSTNYSRAYSTTYSSSYTPPSYRYHTGLKASYTPSFRYSSPSYSSTLPPSGRSLLSSSVGSRPSTASISRTSTYGSLCGTRSTTLPSSERWRSTISRSNDSISSVDINTDSGIGSSAQSWRRSSSISSGLTSRSGSTTSLASLGGTSPRTSRFLKDDTTQSPSYNGTVSRSRTRDDDKLIGRVGLYNLGNTCFMNAVLQCLCHTQPLVDYCIRDTFKSELNYRSPTGGQLIKAFAGLIRTLWRDCQNNAVSPDFLKTELQKYAPQFSGCSQQDAQELLMYLLQGLHDDINRVKSKSDYRSQTNCYVSESQQASESWRRYQNIDDSKIVDLFGGQLKSTLKCTECGHTSITFDPFWNLSLPIPEGVHQPSLQQCFRLFTSPETLDGIDKPMCERCKKKTRSTKQFEINRFPKVLVIQLKRFSSASSYRSKLNTLVECGKSNLDLSPYASSNCINPVSSYNMYAVVNHTGTPSSGHYIAKCKNPYTGEWYEFNDSRVSKTSTTDIVTSSAYLLFYEQGSRIARL